MFKFENGDAVKDVISGFSGVITARLEYLNGCRQYSIRPTKLKDDTVISSEWFDEGQLELLVKQKPLIKKLATAVREGLSNRGGPANRNDYPPKRPTPPSRNEYR